MASKRHLESLDPVIFNKLPRLETEPTTSFPASLCKSSPVPGSENHFNYKGSYFTYPLQSPDGPEQPPARWSPAATYLPYSSGGQPVPAEGMLGTCLLYRPQGSGLQPPSTDKGKDSLMRDLLMERDKWSSPPPALGHPFPVKKPVAVAKAAPLAVPKPVYRPPACFMDPRVALPLGHRGESLQQQPGDSDWALPPAATHPVPPSEPHGGTGLLKRGPHPDPSLPPLHPSLALPAKEKTDSPVAFYPYYATFEKYRGPPSTPFLEASCPATHSQRKVPEVPRVSPDPWHKFQHPAASPVYRERPPPCYPHPHYPLPLHKAPLLYHPPAPPAEAQPSTYKGFGFAGSREPFPSPYLKPQAPRSYFPGPSDPYVPRAAGTVASPPPKPAAVPRDAEPPRQSGYLPSPGFAFSPGDPPVFGTPFSGTEPGCQPQRVESPQRRGTARHGSAFHPVCPPEKVPRGCGGLAETFPKGDGGWVKASRGEQEPPYPAKRRASPAPQETLHSGPPAPIVAGKGDDCKAKDAAKELAPPSPATSPPAGLKDPRDGEVSPSSPPMPVINNVFSLAPYRDYLEGTEGSAQVPFCREHLQGDTPPQNLGGNRDSVALRDISATSSLPPTGTAANRALKMGSSMVQSQGENCSGKVPEKIKLVPQDAGSQGGSPGGVRSEDLAPKDVVLDLSLKKRLVKAGESWGPVGHTEGTPDGEDMEEKESLGEQVRVGKGAQPWAQPLLLEVGSGDKSNFQSSATFIFKKFKILRSLQPSTMPPQHVGSPHAPQPSPPLTAPSSSGTPPASPLASSPPAPQPSASAPQGACPAPPPEPRPAPAEESVLPPGPCEPPTLPGSPGQYFATLHTSLCGVISCSVARSPPELLREWLKVAEPAEELGEVPKSPPKPKNGSRIPEAQKATRGKEIWLAFQDVAALLANLLSQLETFMFSRKCPFPHVVRAGAVFIPIHVVKEKLFPRLPTASVDQVLQEHRVELRPTTLSEEKHLRDLELRSCTSRMLKLLALKQLPDIYPDLLNLHWHHSIRQQLGSSSPAGQHPSK
ncbi:uncharacterized protein C15orf39 homolog isoform 2-T3 [Pterocles gutturalis]